jgi:hypothetical protein
MEHVFEMRFFDKEMLMMATSKSTSYVYGSVFNYEMIGLNKRTAKAMFERFFNKSKHYKIVENWNNDFLSCWFTSTDENSFIKKIFLNLKRRNGDVEDQVHDKHDSNQFQTKSMIHDYHHTKNP